MKQCSYLGHIVGNGFVRPELDKVEAVHPFAIPQTKTNVHAFLGLTGYYRRFIPDYTSYYCSPPHGSHKKNYTQSSPLDQQCDQAFKRLKELLCSSPILQSPDFSRPFILQIDASDQGVGAVLTQRDENGLEHPVSYYSRKLLPRGQRYLTVEKELLAINLVTNAFCVYLLGRPFTIVTDHRSLEWLERLKENNARLTRWSLALQPYDFVVQH